MNWGQVPLHLIVLSSLKTCLFVLPLYLILCSLTILSLAHVNDLLGLFPYGYNYLVT